MIVDISYFGKNGEIKMRTEDFDNLADAEKWKNYMLYILPKDKFQVIIKHNFEKNVNNNNDTGNDFIVNDFAFNDFTVNDFTVDNLCPFDSSENKFVCGVFNNVSGKSKKSKKSRDKVFKLRKSSRIRNRNLRNSVSLSNKNHVQPLSPCLPLSPLSLNSSDSSLVIEYWNYGKGFFLCPDKNHPDYGTKYYHNGWWMTNKEGHKGWFIKSKYINDLTVKGLNLKFVE